MKMRAESVRGPNWYEAMVEFKWTVGNIMRTFGVSRSVAQDIQHAFPSYQDACKIVSAHHELCSQVGH